jgi:hypothetical protein
VAGSCCFLTLFGVVWVHAELAGRVGPLREVWLHSGDKSLQDTWVLARANVCRCLAARFRSILHEIVALLILLALAGAGWHLASRAGVDHRLGACAGVAVLPLLLVSLITVSALRGLPVSKSWLAEPITFREIEAQLPDDHPAFAPEWEAFKAEMVEGDELWMWGTPPESWEHLCGRGGYVIVRDGEPTEHFIVTVMNWQTPNEPQPRLVD